MTDTNDTIQKIADEVQNWRSLPAWQVDRLHERLRALSARASAGEGGDSAERIRWVSNDIHRMYDRGYPPASLKLREWFEELDMALTAAPQPAQAGASGGGDGYVGEVMEPDAWGRMTVNWLIPLPIGTKLYATPASPAAAQGGALSVLAALGHKPKEDDRCRARVVHKHPVGKPPGSGNPPIFCCLKAGHDGPHRCNHGGMSPSFPFRESDEVEFGEPITTCEKCRTAWPCPDARAAIAAAPQPQECE